MDDIHRMGAPVCDGLEHGGVNHARQLGAPVCDGLEHHGGERECGKNQLAIRCVVVIKILGVDENCV